MHLEGPGQQAAQDGTEEATGSKREAYRIFKAQFNLDKPILFNTRFLITQGQVEQALDKAINRNVNGRQQFKPSEQMEAVEWIEDCGPAVVGHLLHIARTTSDDEKRHYAVMKLSENALRKVIFIYGRKPDTHVRAWNKTVYEENLKIKDWVFQKGDPLEKQKEILGLWEDWYGKVRKERYDVSFSGCLYSFFFETRFANYWWKLLHLDFGISHIDKRPVLGKLLGKVKYSLTLAVPSLIIAYLIAVPLGVLSAVKRNSTLDKAVSVFLFMLYSLPSFFVGTMLLVTPSAKDLIFSGPDGFPLVDGRVPTLVNLQR